MRGGQVRIGLAKWDQVRKVVTVELADTLDQFACTSDKESNLFNRAERAIRGIEMEDVQEMCLSLEANVCGSLRALLHLEMTRRLCRRVISIERRGV